MKLKEFIEASDNIDIFTFCGYEYIKRWSEIAENRYNIDVGEETPIVITTNEKPKFSVKDCLDMEVYSFVITSEIMEIYGNLYTFFEANVILQ